MKKIIYLAILGIVVGELMLFFGHVYPGLAIHIINLQLITIYIIFGNFPSEIKKVLQSLLLPVLLRIVNLGMPQFWTTLFWYPLTYGVMFIPVYYIIKNQQISSKEIGLDFRNLHIFLPAAILTGSMIALSEYSILRPASLIESADIPNLALIIIVMFVFVAAIEELIFRSILQTRLEKVLGLRYGVLVSGILFGIMHAGYGLINEILFASLFGIVLGLIFQKTRSFPFILVIHGTANVLLFGILPKALA